MGKYRIVSARPRNASNHLKSEFKAYELRTENGRVSWGDPTGGRSTTSR